MSNVWFTLLSHWGIFLLGFVVGIFWATRPQEDVERSSQRRINRAG